MGVEPGQDFAAGFPRERIRVLGIDPGTVHTGWGVVEVAKGSPVPVAHGTIGTSGISSQGNRLCRIFQGLQEVLSLYRPRQVSLEKVFFARNAQSTLKLGQARGVALLAVAERGIAVYEYTSAEIKLAVVGYGQASKDQVQKMVSSLLCLSRPISGDAADALAAAICHIHQLSFHRRVAAAMTRGRQMRQGKMPRENVDSGTGCADNE